MQQATASSAAIAIGGAPGVSASQMLSRFASAAGLQFDPTAAAQSLRQGQRDFPDHHPHAAKLRLGLAAEPQGLQLIARHLSLRDALALPEPEIPLALPLGPDRWAALLNGRPGGGLVVGLAPDGEAEWLSLDDLTQRLGLESPDLRLEWITAVPSAPMATAHAPQHGHDQHGHEQHGHEQHGGPSPFQRLLSLLVPERRDIALVLLFAVGVGVLNLAVPITAAAVVNNVAFAIVMQPLLALCVALFTCLALSGMLRGYKHYLVEIIQQRLFVRVVADLAYRLPRVGLKAFDQQHGPELVNRFFDVLTVQKASAALLLDGVALALQTLVGLLVLAVYHQYLFGFDLLLIAGLVFIVWGLGHGAVRTAIRESRAKYAVASWIEEMARHPFAFKLSGGSVYALETADALAREYLFARRSHFRIVFRQFGFALFLQALASSVLLGLGGWLVIQNELSLGQLVAAELIVNLVVSAFAKFGKQLEYYYDLLAAVHKLGHLTDLPLERQTGAAHRHEPGPAALRVRNLGFAYEAGHRRALDGVSFELRPGERVALLGGNGAGKSTLVDLLFGLREPDAGHIELDGLDLRDLRLESVRAQVAAVKGIEIFEGSVLDNLRMGRDEIALADVRRALDAVRLLDDILDLPQGLHTRLGTGGAPLSFGQAQRLMLARAIVGKPRLLLIDELLDDMDLDVRESALGAILDPQAPWTLLLVTHSPELAGRCGRRLVLERPHHDSAPAAH